MTGSDGASQLISRMLPSAILTTAPAKVRRTVLSTRDRAMPRRRVHCSTSERKLASSCNAALILTDVGSTSRLNRRNCRQISDGMRSRSGSCCNQARAISRSVWPGKPPEILSSGLSSSIITHHQRYLGLRCYQDSPPCDLWPLAGVWYGPTSPTHPGSHARPGKRLPNVSTTFLPSAHDGTGGTKRNPVPGPPLVPAG